ncbi:TonB-dependent receptor [Thalassolituus marinus]|uniref:TonB-dependent receptor n=1 Tax=Thalassolituus marinus TaxID=671053 RepID=A0ABS7ZW63_9GAMM|nr:TonB-dependent receptor [Thalassolituus marinus]MCA6064651.1 TonB-dependent receptor [Thalassolituus marinus]
MKLNPILLGAASALFTVQVMAGQAVFYVTEEGSAVRDLAVTVDGKKKLVSSSGFVVFDIENGDHKVELSQYGEWLGEFNFETENSQQNAEVQVEMLGGEAMPDINVYTPGQEQVVALGQISGYLQSEETGGPVSGARVTVEGTELAVMTDNDGFFSFELPRGAYDVVVNHPNYGKRDVSGIRVMGNVNTGVNLTMSMSGDGMIEEVVAVGSYIPSTATAQERDSSAVLDAIGAEQMARFGDSSAASALTRVAGVSVVGGQFAVVRGMAGRYISATLNGSPMPSTDPMRRDVPLDLFPASVLGGIDIQKTFTADMPGDSTGGAIRMSTKGMPDEDGSKATVTLGLNTRTTFSDVNGYEGGEYDFMGFDDGTRELPSYADSLTNGGRDSINYCSNAALCLTPDQGVELSKSFENIYNVDQVQARPEKGFSLSTGKLLDSGVGLYGAFSYKDKWSARHDAQVDDGGVYGTYERTKRNIDVAGYFVAGMEDENSSYSSKTILLRKTDDTISTKSVYDDSKDQQVDSVLLQWVERQYLGEQISGEHIFNSGDTEHTINWRAGIAQTTRYEPDRRSYQFINENILTGSLERRYSELTETAMDLGLDYKMEMLAGDDLYIRMKTGFMVSNKDREVTMGRFGVQRLNSDASQVGTLEEILSDTAFENYDYAINTLTTETDNYDATDEMLAGYLAGEVDVASVTMIAGARMESSTQTLEYPDASASDNELTSDKVLPMAGMIWRANDELQFRASFSQTISRPGLTERSASVQYDPETDDPLQGNPDLEISDITNLDLRAEYYFSDEENITLALFNKTVDSPIERTVANADGSAATGFTFRNEDTADLSGVEIDFRKNTLDTDSLTGFISGNLTYIDAEVTLSPETAKLEGRDSRQLQGQSKYLANLQFGFDHLTSGQSLTLLVNYFDDRIYAANRGDLEYEVERGRTTLDLVYRYDVSDVMTVKAKAKNITDAKVAYARADQEIESYYNGADITASLEYLF